MKIFDFHPPIQLNLFDPAVLRSESLKAETSRRKAFYSIRLMEECGRFSVKKESGANGKTYHEKTWFFPGETEAQSFFERKIREKTNSNRKQRLYRREM